MKFLLSVLLTAALSFIAGLFLPWWSIAIISFGVALLMQQKVALAFLAGFTAIYLLWSGLAFLIDINNQQLLSHKIAQIFPLGGSSFLLIMVTGFVGSLVGGFAAMAGSSIRLRRATY